MLQKLPPEVFCKKSVLRNFAKHLCQRLFFNKVADLRPKTCNYFKETVTGVSLWIGEISKTPYLQNISGRLLLVLLKQELTVYWIKISTECFFGKRVSQMLHVHFVHFVYHWIWNNSLNLFWRKSKGDCHKFSGKAVFVTVFQLCLNLDVKDESLNQRCF